MEDLEQGTIKEHGWLTWLATILSRNGKHYRDTGGSCYHFITRQWTTVSRYKLDIILPARCSDPSLNAADNRYYSSTAKQATSHQTISNQTTSHQLLIIKPLIKSHPITIPDIHIQAMKTLKQPHLDTLSALKPHPIHPLIDPSPFLRNKKPPHQRRERAAVTKRQLTLNLQNSFILSIPTLAPHALQNLWSCTLGPNR